MTVLIADDYYVFRQGVKVMLSYEPDLKVVGEATTSRQTVEQAIKLKPDAVVMDLSMGGLSGVEVIRKILADHPEAKILIVSGQADQRVIDEALAAGAKGFLSKSGSLHDVPVALREIQQGRPFVKLARSSRATHSAI
jgi:DNA-binding NarL/FixJ family response regulator